MRADVRVFISARRQEAFQAIFLPLDASSYLAPLIEPLRQLLFGMKSGVFPVILLPSWVKTRNLLQLGTRSLIDL